MAPRSPWPTTLDAMALRNVGIRAGLALLVGVGLATLTLPWLQPTSTGWAVFASALLLLASSQALSALAEQLSERRPDLSITLQVGSFLTSFALGALAVVQVVFLPTSLALGYAQALEDTWSWIALGSGGLQMWMVGGALATSQAIVLSQRLRRSRRERAQAWLGSHRDLAGLSIKWGFPFVGLSPVLILPVYALLLLAWSGDRLSRAWSRRFALPATRALDAAVRRGALGEQQVFLLGHLGHPGVDALPPLADLRAWALELAEFGQEVCVRAALLAAELALPVWEEARPGDGRVRAGLDAVSDWLSDPGPAKRPRLLASIEALGGDALPLRATRDACLAASRSERLDDPPLRFAATGARGWSTWGLPLVARDAASAIERVAAMTGEPDAVRGVVETGLTAWVLGETGAHVDAPPALAGTGQPSLARS